MKQLGCLAGLIILIFLGLTLTGVIQDAPQQVQATGSYQAFVPIAKKAPATPTPKPDPYDPSWIQRTPGAIWQITELRMWTCLESNGSYVLVIESRDTNGQPINGIPFLVVGNGGSVLRGVTGNKAPGVTEVPLYRDSWRVYVDGQSSDIGMDLREDLENDPGCLLRYGNHLSYIARFQKAR